MEYSRRFLDSMAGMKNPVTLELFSPAAKGWLQEVSTALPNFSLELSLESHDEEVRGAFGKYYTNQAVERTIRSAFDAGCQRLDIYFMIGLPKQTPESVMDTVGYCGELLDRYGQDGKLHLFVSPLAPFLDPGSMAFEQPEQHGYRIFYRTLEEHRRALLQPSWKNVLNYETEWMSREEIVLSTYEASLELNRLKLRHGLMTSQEANRAEDRTTKALRLLELLDRVEEGNGNRLEELRPELERANAIVARPWNDWELGLSLGRWGLLKQVYYLVSQGLSAFGGLFKTSTGRPGVTTSKRATKATGSGD
jgi:hypothetical protein